MQAGEVPHSRAQPLSYSSLPGRPQRRQQQRPASSKGADGLRSTALPLSGPQILETSSNLRATSVKGAARIQGHRMQAF